MWFKKKSVSSHGDLYFSLSSTLDWSLCRNEDIQTAFLNVKSHHIFLLLISLTIKKAFACFHNFNGFVYALLIADMFLRLFSTFLFLICVCVFSMTVVKHKVLWSVLTRSSFGFNWNILLEYYQTLPNHVASQSYKILASLNPLLVWS